MKIHNPSITGSLIVSGSNVKVDFTTVDNGVSGSLSGSFTGALQSKDITNALTRTTISGSTTSLSSSVAADVAANLVSITNNSSSVASDVAANLVSITTNSSSFASRYTNQINQDLRTTASPTFVNTTVTGTLTAQEIHTEFESASILFTSGSTIFGNSSDDIHNMTGSLNVSGGLFVKDGTLTVTDNVDFNGNLDVDGTTNLDVVDIDGNVTIGNTVVNPASGFADQTGIGLKHSATVPEVNISSDAAGLQVGRTSTGGAGKIAEFRKESNVVFDIDTAGSVSGSFTSTGSFGRIQTIAADIGTTTGTTLDLTDSITQTKAGNLTHTMTAGGSGEAALRLVANNTTGDPFIRFETNATTYAIGIDNSDSDIFKIDNSSDPGGATRIAINSSGNVGIGSSSPTAKLDVNGGAVINGDTIVGRGGNQKGKLTIQSRTGTASRKTNAIVAVPYNDTSESICMIGMDGQAGNNEMHIGSNTGDFMSPTFIDFFTASDVNSQTNKNVRPGEPIKYADKGIGLARLPTSGPLHDIHRRRLSRPLENASGDNGRLSRGRRCVVEALQTSIEEPR